VTLVITGGDPLKRPGLEALVRHGSACGLNMALTPSATPLLTIEALTRLREAGLKRIAISVDGIDAVTHDDFRGVPGTFERSIAMLTAARQLGLETQINSSIGRHNAHQLTQLATLAGFLGVSLWSVFLLVPTGRATTDLLLTAVEHEKLYRALAKIALDPATAFPIKTTAGQAYYRVLEQERLRRGVAPARRRGVGVNDGNGFVFISHVGDICPSGFLPLVCGNVRRDTVADIYREHPTFVRLRDPDNFSGKCGQCFHNRLCGGSRSRTFALMGDPFASDPTCIFQPKASS
jgi:MoaA/NifB/PqqE/SkfB family radical SAM enzyme